LNYRAREFDLDLPLLIRSSPSTTEHLERALEMVLEIGKDELLCSLELQGRYG